jgi:hypothetical protein
MDRIRKSRGRDSIGEGVRDEVRLAVSATASANVAPVLTIPDSSPRRASAST